MSTLKAPATLSITWEGGRRFVGRVGEVSVVLDGDGIAGPSPVQALALGLAGCMGIDVASILVKGRHGLHALTASLSYRRAEGVPARLVSADLHFLVVGDVPGEAVERAIQLSRDKYCSVWHSMRADIDLQVTHEQRPAPA
jgi:putative redox protein